MKITVRAKPNASKREVLKVSEDLYDVFVPEPPVKGMANAAITRALAEHFNVSISSVRLVAGYTSRQKIFVIDK